MKLEWALHVQVELFTSERPDSSTPRGSLPETTTVHRLAMSSSTVTCSTLAETYTAVEMGTRGVAGPVQYAPRRVLLL